MKNYISKINNQAFSKARPEGLKLDTIVITYSACEGDISQTLTSLYNRGASVHYLIDQQGFQNQFISEDKMAFFAGKSSWHHQTSLNSNSIGVMLINDAESAFPDVQVDKLIELIKDINERHDTEMETLGLGEVALNRHIAPGPLFPWSKLAEAGVVNLVEIPSKISKDCKLNPGEQNNAVESFQKSLIVHGYGIDATGIFDDLTTKAVNVFTQKYVPGHNLCWSDATEYVLNELTGVDNSYLMSVEVKSEL